MHIFRNHPYISLSIVGSLALAIFYYFYEVENVRSFDAFIDWVAQWPLYFLRLVFHFYTRLLKDIIQGLKSVAVDAFHELINVFKF